MARARVLRRVVPLHPGRVRGAVGASAAAAPDQEGSLQEGHRRPGDNLGGLQRGEFAAAVTVFLHCIHCNF